MFSSVSCLGPNYWYIATVFLTLLFKLLRPCAHVSGRALCLYPFSDLGHFSMVHVFII